MNIEGKTDKQLQRMVVASWKRRLKLSIEDIKEGKMFLGQQNCAFCVKYWSEGNCPDCPVSSKTRSGHCRGTPFKRASTLYYGIRWKAHRKIKTFHKSVQKVIDFVKALEC